MTAILFASVFFTVFFLLTLYFQQVQHYSAIRTGVAYLPFGVVISLGIGLASQLAPRVGVKALFCAGAALFSTGVLLLSRITVHGSYWTRPFPAMVVMALGAGINFATFGIASVHQVSGEDASLASGVQQTASAGRGWRSVWLVLATLAALASRPSPRRPRRRQRRTGGPVLPGRSGGCFAAALLVALVAVREARFR